MGDNTYLKYGDLILLNYESVDGYLQTQGFTNKSCFIQADCFGTQIFSRNSRDYVFQIFPKLNYEARKDYEQALKFYQRNIQRDIKGNENDKSKTDKGKIGKSHTMAPMSKQQTMNKIQKEKQIQEKANFEKRILQLKKKLVEEEDLNRKILERRRGEFVQYGAELQLLHIDSEEFLCARKTCAEIDKTCNKVDFSEKGSQSIYFRVMPRYKFRQEGEKILYGDQFVLQSIKLNLYLHITDKVLQIEKPIKIKKIHDDPAKEITPIIIDRREPPINYTPMLEVNLSTSLSRFKAVPFCPFDEDDKKFVRGGTVIMLQHSELGGYLASDDSDFTNDGLAEVFLWTFKGKQSDVENFNTASLFEVELVKENNRGRICRESNDKEFDHIFRLRHLNTGRLVIAQEIDFGGQTILSLGLAPHLELIKNPNSNKPNSPSDYMIEREAKEKLESNSLFSFITTNLDEDTRIKNQNCLKIQHVETKQFLSVKKKAMFTTKHHAIVKKKTSIDKNEELRQSQSKGFSEKGGMEQQLFQPIEDSEINQAYRNVLELKEKAGYEDAFFFQIIDKDTLQDILFVHTSVGCFKKCIPYLCGGSQDIPKDKINTLESIMRKMMLFAEGKGDQADIDFDQEQPGEKEEHSFAGGTSEDDINVLKQKILKRQKIMRELYVIEYLVQILYYPFASETYDLDKITQADPITRICSLAYELLKASVGGYTVNEMYASQWINFFFMQAMKTNNDNDILAQSTVQELLSDNKKLLEQQITPQIIKQFIQLVRTQQKHKRLIKLLTALCTCFGLPIAHNQNDIVKYLLEDEENREKLILPIRQKDKKVEVRLKVGKYIPIQQLEQDSMQRNDGRIYKYFLSLIDLAADLNQGRNNNAFQQLVNQFPFDAVFQIIYDNNLKFDMRSYFIKLINKMYLDREPMEPLQIPTMTIVLNEIPSLKDLIMSSELGFQIQSSKIQIPFQLMQYKNFILTFLQNEKGIQNIADKQKNKFTLVIIESLFFMLTHGFYKSQRELNEIALPLILLLDGTNDVYGEKGLNQSAILQIDAERSAKDRFKYTKENEIILQSKKIQCDCLIFISQLELDGKTQLFLSKMKSEFENYVTDQQVQLGKSLFGNLMQDNGASPQKRNEGRRIHEGQLENSKMLVIESQGSVGAPQNQSQQLLLSKLKASYNEKVEGDPAMFNQSNLEFLETVASIKGTEEEIGEIYVCILFDLMLYKYPDLNQTAFELLIRYFNRKSILLESISNTQILESKSSIEILNKVKVYQNELRIYQSDSDVWMNKSDKNAVDSKIRTMEIFQNLTMFCSLALLDNRNQLLTSTNVSKSVRAHKNASVMSFGEGESPEKIKDLLGKLKDDRFVKQKIQDSDDSENLTPQQEEFVMFVNSFKKENKENQRILKNFEIHEFAIYFIKYRMEQNDAQNETYINLIKSCYRLLIRFVRDNNSNQQTLRDYLDVFIRDLDRYSLASRLIYEIFKNNKIFMNLNMGKMLKQITNQADEAPITSPKKASLFKLLESFCICKKKLVRGNQQDIILYLTENAGKNTLLYLFSNEGYVELCHYLNQAKEIDLLEHLKEETQSTYQCPTMMVTVPIFNIMTCLDLLAKCCEGKSDLAEQKCQQEVVQLENCYKILDACEYFWPFKSTMLNFVSQCYLDSSIKTLFGEGDDYGQKYIFLIAEIVVNDMINIVENMQQEEEVLVQYPSSSTKTLKQEAMGFVCNSVIPFFRLLLKRKQVTIKPVNEKILIAFSKFIAKLYYITNEPNVKSQSYGILKYIHESPIYSKFLDNIKHPLMSVGPGNEQPADVPMGEHHETITDTSKSSKLSAKIYQLLNNPEVKIQIEKEFDNLVLWVTNIESKIKEVCNGRRDYTVDQFENLSFQSIISAILQMLDKRSLSKDLHLAGLKLIRKIIEIENKNLKTPAADWDTDEWYEFKHMIKLKQDALVEIGCVQFICKHISEVDDDAILEQCILLCIALLLGGNPKSQEAFYKYLLEQDEYNKVLTKVKQTLIKQFENAKNFLSEKYDRILINAKKEEKRSKTQNAQVKEKVSKALIDKLLHGKVEHDDSVEQLLTVDELTGNTQETEGGQKVQPSNEEQDQLQMDHKQQSVFKCIRILRFLQLLTENHYTPMQNFLRQQQLNTGTPNPKTFDFVSYISSLLSLKYIQYPIRITKILQTHKENDGDVEKQYDEVYSCNLGYQMIETLTEFIQGPCKDNQKTLVSSKVIDNCRDLISSNQTERELVNRGFTETQQKVLDGLKSKAVKLLLSILEGPIDADIIRSVTISLDDFIVIFDRLKYVYDEFVKNILKLPEKSTLSQVNDQLDKDSFDDDTIIEGFDLFTMIKTLSDCYPTARKIIEPYSETIYYEFFKLHTGNIEILVEEDLQRVYFPIKPVCRFLSKESRQHLMINVDRQSPQQKIIGLLKAVPDLVDEMEHIQMMDNVRFMKAKGEPKMKIFIMQLQSMITLERLNFLRDMSTVIAFIICGLILAFYQYDQITYPDGNIDIGPSVDDNIDLAISVLGYIQLVTSVTLLIGWINNKAKLIINAGWRNYIDENRIKYAGFLKQKEQQDADNFQQIKAKQMSFMDARMLLITSGPGSDEFMDQDGKFDLGHLLLKIEYIWTSITFVMRNGSFVFFVIYVGLSVLGVKQSPIYYAIQLLDIVNRFATLRNVIEAVRFNSNQLLLTALLEMILIYIYSVLGFAFLYDFYFNDDIYMEDLGEKGDSVCQNLFHCFVSTINFGLRAGGGIGEFLPPLSYFNNTKEEYFIRVIFDLSFFLIVIIFFFNIIFGIIIDTFAELRDKKREIDEDMRNVCFICNIGRETFERDSGDGVSNQRFFTYHIKNEHNLWQYVFFIIHLKSKDKIDYNGTESYIHEKLQQEDISLFPLHCSISLQKDKYIISEKSDGNTIYYLNPYILDKKKTLVKKESKENNGE